jgi:hypothetical protein
VAGKRQHYLPVFLQTGFASSPNGRRTWLYRKNAEAKEVGIRDVGSEEYFYGDASDTTLDDEITEAETTEYSNLVHQLRQNVRPENTPVRLAKFIAHLEVRSRNLRAGFGETVEKLCDKTVIALRRPGVFQRLMKGRSAEPSTPLMDLIRQQLALANDDQMRPLLNVMLPAAEAMLRPRLQAVAIDSHRKALMRSIAPDIRAKQYEVLDFRTIEIPEGNMLLGDSAVVFHVTGERSFKPFLDKEDDIVAVFLPIASHKILLAAPSPYQIDEEITRLAIARTSHTFFIGGRDSAANAALIEHIGLDALPLADTDLEEIVEQVIRGE